MPNFLKIISPLVENSKNLDLRTTRIVLQWNKMLESRNFWQGSCHWEILAAVETNECLTNNGGCWQKGNITACQVREISSYVSPDCFFLKHPSENKNIFFSYRNLSPVLSLFLGGCFMTLLSGWIILWHRTHSVAVYVYAH